MNATGLLTRRLLLPPGEVAALCDRLGLLVPPRFEATALPIRTDGLLRNGAVHPSVAAGLAATCSPHVGVLITSDIGDVTAALGVRGDLGGSMVRAGGFDVEVAAWPAARLGAELSRVVPALGDAPRSALHLPLAELADDAGLRAAVVGALRATVVAPPSVLGQVVWLATEHGWLALEPAEVREGRRWATVRPVAPNDLGAAVAPLVAVGLA